MGGDDEGGRGTSLNGTFGFERFGLCSERWRGGEEGVFQTPPPNPVGGSFGHCLLPAP